jgi:hypothetical protein
MDRQSFKVQPQLIDGKPAFVNMDTGLPIKLEHTPEEIKVRYQPEYTLTDFILTKGVITVDKPLLVTSEGLYGDDAYSIIRGNGRYKMLCDLLPLESYSFDPITIEITHPDEETPEKLIELGMIDNKVRPLSLKDEVTAITALYDTVLQNGGSDGKSLTETEARQYVARKFNRKSNEVADLIEISTAIYTSDELNELLISGVVGVEALTAIVRGYDKLFQEYPNDEDQFSYELLCNRLMNAAVASAQSKISGSPEKEAKPQITRANVNSLIGEIRTMLSSDVSTEEENEKQEDEAIKRTAKRQVNELNEGRKRISTLSLTDCATEMKQIISTLDSRRVELELFLDEEQRVEVASAIGVFNQLDFNVYNLSGLRQIYKNLFTLKLKLDEARTSIFEAVKLSKVGVTAVLPKPVKLPSSSSVEAVDPAVAMLPIETVPEAATELTAVGVFKV